MPLRSLKPRWSLIWRASLQAIPQQLLQSKAKPCAAPVDMSQIRDFFVAKQPGEMPPTSIVGPDSQPMPAPVKPLEDKQTGHQRETGRLLLRQWVCDSAGSYSRGRGDYAPGDPCAQNCSSARQCLRRQACRSGRFAGRTVRAGKAQPPELGKESRLKIPCDALLRRLPSELRGPAWRSDVFPDVEFLLPEPPFIAASKGTGWRFH